MTSNHLLSTSLFNELFQHNLVSPDGRIIADEDQLQGYAAFLIQQSKDRVVSLHKERNKLVKDAQELLESDYRTKEEDKLLERLLDELDLEFDENYLLSLKKPKKQPKRYLGPEKPLKNVFERKIEADLKRVKILKRDLRILDGWLEQMSHLSTRREDDKPTDWKEAEKRFRERTSKRMCDMDKARKKLIKSYYKSHDKMLKKLLNQKQQTKDKHADKKSAPTRLSEKKKDKSPTVERSEDTASSQEEVEDTTSSPSENDVREDDERRVSFAASVDSTNKPTDNSEETTDDSEEITDDSEETTDNSEEY